MKIAIGHFVCPTRVFGAILKVMDHVFGH